MLYRPVEIRTQVHVPILKLIHTQSPACSGGCTICSEVYSKLADSYSTHVLGIRKISHTLNGLQASADKLQAEVRNMAAHTLLVKLS